jgi:hypothetical protein
VSDAIGDFETSIRVKVESSDDEVFAGMTFAL